MSDDQVIQHDEDATNEAPVVEEETTDAPPVPFEAALEAEDQPNR